MPRARYSCQLCALLDVEVDVPDRAPGQDLVYFIEKVVAPIVYADHQTRTPGCEADHFSNLKIPINRLPLH